MRLDRDDGTWRDYEDVAALIERFVRGEEPEEMTPEYQAAIGTMDDKNLAFFRTYRPDPIINKRNALSMLNRGIARNIGSAMSKYPNVLNHDFFNKL